MRGETRGQFPISWLQDFKEIEDELPTEEIELVPIEEEYEQLTLF